MKTIAITMDEETLRKVAQMEEREGRSRSDIVREAVHEFVAERERNLEEEREREIFHRHRKKLNRQADILVREQAKL